MGEKPTFNKIAVFGDLIFSEITKVGSGEFVLTPLWVQGKFCVSRNTADGIIARVEVLAQEKGYKTARERGSLRICLS